MRGRVDAVIVGRGTVLADDPLLTARPPGPRIPARVVLSASGNLPEKCQLRDTAHEVPLIVFTAAGNESNSAQLHAKYAALSQELVKNQFNLVNELLKQQITLCLTLLGVSLIFEKVFEKEVENTKAIYKLVKMSLEFPLLIESAVNIGTFDCAKA